MSGRERANILLVGGKPDRRARYEAALRGLGENLLEAPSAATALELLRTTDVAVVLADAHGTDMDGVDLACAIHGRLGRRDTAVLLAGRARARERVGQHLPGPVEFVSEPIVLESLRTRIRVLLELFRKSRRLERLVEERAAHIRRYEDDLQQIAHAAAHDLQEPLRTVSSFVRLLAQRPGTDSDAEAQGMVRFALDGIEQLHERIVALGAYARAHVDGRGFRAVDCGIAFERAVANLRQALRASGAQVTRGPLPVLRADEAQIVLLLQNLIGNAIQFARAGVRPEIRVEAVPHGPDWLFAVRDNGMGIEPEHQERIFLVFRRLHPRVTHPGAGIGLALCRTIAANHGGRIWVESTPGQGSVFRFTLPMPLRGAPRNGRRASRTTSPEPSTGHHA